MLLCHHNSQPKRRPDLLQLLSSHLDKIPVSRSESTLNDRMQGLFGIPGQSFSMGSEGKVYAAEPDNSNNAWSMRKLRKWVQDIAEEAVEEYKASFFWYFPLFRTKYGLLQVLIGSPDGSAYQFHKDSYVMNTAGVEQSNLQTNGTKLAHMEENHVKKRFTQGKGRSIKQRKTTKQQVACHMTMVDDIPVVHRLDGFLITTALLQIIPHVNFGRTDYIHSNTGHQP